MHNFVNQKWHIVPLNLSLQACYFDALFKTRSCMHIVSAVTKKIEIQHDVSEEE